MLLFSAIVLVSLMTLLVAGEPTAVLNTTSGPVQGEILTTIIKSVKYSSFVGIRYAKPPVGYLRFKPPVSVDPWTETLNATVEGDKCAQLNYVTKAIDGSEDCLFLNVATPVTNLPRTPKKLKSVMVWIHGGAFFSGTSSLKRYSPDYLIERDVVYVSVSYRLGAFGFLTLNHPNATGNAGLKDQNLALKWIQSNIKNFGGNPDNVTLLGQSAGAMCIGFHTLSDASAGLFHGTISMSGTALVPWAFNTPTKALTIAKKLGVAMGTNSNDKEILLKTFYAASTEELVKATSVVSKSTPLTPTLEDTSLGTDVFLSECSVNKYVSGNFSKVPQMLGFVQQETMIYLANSGLFTYIVNAALDAHPSSFLSEIRDSLRSLEKLAKKQNNNLFEIVVNETSDILFTSQIDLTQSILVANNDDKPVYYYHFTFDPNISLHDLETDSKYYGVTHNDDLSYVFWYPTIGDNLGPIDRTIHRVSTMWTNFAKYGNPTPQWIDDCSLGVTWPASGRSGRALEIGTELVVVSRPINLNTEIVKSAIKENLGLSNGCTASTTQHSCRDN